MQDEPKTDTNPAEPKPDKEIMPSLEEMLKHPVNPQIRQMIGDSGRI